VAILRGFALVLLLVALSPAARADDADRVYTNLDLERLFGPPSVNTGPVVTNDDADWEFVKEFLEREHARIDADRSYELERRRQRLETDRTTRRDAHISYGYPYYPYAHGNVRLSHPSRQGGRIVPLHARPSLAQINRSKARRLSGVDAFPGNRRRAERSAGR
jgi:hypothetical protein